MRRRDAKGESRHRRGRLARSAVERISDSRKDEEWLRSVFEASPDVIVVADLKGNVVDCNEAALKLYGTTAKEDLVGKSYFELMVRRDRQRAAKNLKKTLKHGFEENVEYTLLTKSGREYRAELSASVVRDASGKPTCFVGILKDITERRNAEEALSSSERRYRSVVDNIAIGVSVISPKMEILALNKQMKKLFPKVDVSKRPICYKTFNSPPRKSVCSYCPTHKTLRDGRVHESITDTPLGSKIVHFRVISSPVKNKSGKIVAAIEMVDDVTERLMLEEELKRHSERLEQLIEERTRKLSESEERFRSVVIYASEAIVTVDDAVRIVFWNKAAEAIFGYSAKEALGKSVTLIMPRGTRENGLKSVRNAIARGEPSSVGKTFEVLGARKDGSRFPMELSFSVWRTTEGQFSTGIIRDITERKKMEQALRSSEGKLRSLFENVPDGIYRSSRGGRILDANPALVGMLGYDSLDELMKIDIARDLYAKKGERAFWKGELDRKGEIRNAEIVLKRRNGQKLVVLENAHVVRDDHGKILHYEGTLTDINERKVLEERLSALNSYSRRLNSAKDFDEVYDLTLDALEKSLGFSHSSFEILEKGALRIARQRGYTGLHLLPCLPLNGAKGGIVVKAANARKPIVVPDVRRDADYIEGYSGCRSEVAVPVIAEDEVLGVLNVESEELDDFDRQDVMLLMILASHAGTAINNLRRRDELEKRSAQQASLMKSSAEMIHSSDLHQRLQAILDAISGLGWRRVVLSVRDENLDIAQREDIVTAGLTDDEREYLWVNRQSGRVWQERFGQEFERFRIGEFYYLPWSDSWVRKRFADGTVSSHLKPEEMVDWHPEDLLYAPLRLADGRVVGVVSIDDPVDGRRPTKEALTPLELFLHQAAVAIENARLIEQLDSARTQIQEYAGELEVKVRERTKELVDAQAKLLKTERLAAIGELAGMVGHDLRNPLTGIAGATYYLKSKYRSRLDPRGKEMLKIIEKDIDYSNKIINDLLEYSREVKLELTETDPKSLVKEVLCCIKVPKKVRIIDETGCEPKLRVDVKRMRRVFTNLIRNAIDAMPKGGSLTIKSARTDDCVAFSFSDTGNGMNQKTLDKLWTPLFTTKAKGMGFGLPICKRFVEGHAGRITVESVVGKGSTFTVTLPLKLKTEDKEEEVWVNLPQSLMPRSPKA